MKKFHVLSAVASALLLLVSVSSSYAFPQNSGESSEKNPDIQSTQAVPSLSGKVVETMDSGGYTYVNIEKDGKKIWVAVPPAKITVGQDISFYPGMPMNNFTSKTLNRTFETIIFSGGVMGEGSADPLGKTSHNTQSKAPQTAAVKVDRATGPNAYTVEELYTKSGELDSKGIVVRGKVVKVSENIMGKNWIHIQDGSGDPSKGTNDIIVTSNELLSVGDIATLKGTLYTNKDFGSGYKYAVIVEEASVKK